LSANNPSLDDSICMIVRLIRRWARGDRCDRWRGVWGWRVFLVLVLLGIHVDSLGLLGLLGLVHCIGLVWNKCALGVLIGVFIELIDSFVYRIRTLNVMFKDDDDQESRNLVGLPLERQRLFPHQRREQQQ
jgi:hypothetical protein